MWQRASVVAILKPGKPSSSPESYPPNHCYVLHSNFLKGLSLTQLTPSSTRYFHFQLNKQVFVKNRSTADPVRHLTQNIEQAFHDREVVGSVFLDLKAAYDTVWHKGLNLKLSKLRHCSKMTNLIINLLYCRSFILHTNYGQSSRSHNLKNKVAEGSALAPTF